ncbi:carbohydrate binding [Branchiostoma belcheri]|nr:carbohydrate binding [Branchiostoma belcheri]
MQQKAEEAKKQEMKKAQQERERLDLLKSFGGPVENSEDLETFLQNLSGNTKTLQLKFSAAKKQLSLEQLKANLRQILEHPAPSNTPGTEQNEEVPRGESPLPRPEDDADVAYEDSWYVGRVVEIHDSGLVASVLFLQRSKPKSGAHSKQGVAKFFWPGRGRTEDVEVSKRQKRMDREALLQEDNALDVVPLRDIETDDPEVDEEYLTRFSGDQKYYTARVIEFSDNKAQLLKKVYDDITGKKKKQKKGAGGSKEKANNASKKSSRLMSIIATFRYRRQLDMKQEGGVYVHRREDHCHIPKLIPSHLRGEPPRWFNHHALEEALHPVEGEPKTRLTEAALFGWRKQSVKDAETLLPYHVGTFLHHRGYTQEANYIKTVAGWHEAADGRGLSEEAIDIYLDSD